MLFWSLLSCVLLVVYPFLVNATLDQLVSFSFTYTHTHAHAHTYTHTPLLGTGHHSQSVFCSLDLLDSTTKASGLSSPSPSTILSWSLSKFSIPPSLLTRALCNSNAFCTVTSAVSVSLLQSNTHQVNQLLCQFSSLWFKKKLQAWPLFFFFVFVHTVKKGFWTNTLWTYTHLNVGWRSDCVDISQHRRIGFLWYSRWC